MVFYVVAFINLFKVFNPWTREFYLKNENECENIDNENFITNKNYNSENSHFTKSSNSEKNILKAELLDIIYEALFNMHIFLSFI